MKGGKSLGREGADEIKKSIRRRGSRSGPRSWAATDIVALLPRDLAGPAGGVRGEEEGESKKDSISSAVSGVCPAAR